MQLRTFLRESDLCRCREDTLRRIWAFNRVPGARKVIEDFILQQNILETWGLFCTGLSVWPSDQQDIETYWKMIYIRFRSIPLDDLREIFFGKFLISRKCDTEPHQGIQAFRSGVPTSFWMPSCFQVAGSLRLFMTISENAITSLGWMIRVERIIFVHGSTCNGPETRVQQGYPKLVPRNVNVLLTGDGCLCRQRRFMDLHFSLPGV